MMLRDGLCAIDDKGTFSSALTFTDINYQIATDAAQKDIFGKYMECLNAFGSEINLQLLINNRVLDETEFENNVLIENQNDYLDPYRNEFNDAMRDKVWKGNNKIVTDKFFIYNIQEETVEKARKTVDQLDSELERKMKELGCNVSKLDGKARLELMYHIMYPEEKFCFSYDNLGGYDTTKDAIAPSQLEFYNDHFMIDGRFCRILFIKDWSTEMPDELISQITRIEKNLTISFNMKAIPRGEDIALVKNKLATMEMEVSNAQAKAVGYDPDLNVSQELKRSVAEAQAQLSDVQDRNQRLFECQFLIMLNAETEQELEELTKSIKLIAKNRTIQIDTLWMQQKAGFNASLPIGNRVPYRNRTLTTSVCANMTPFISQEMMDKQGIYYGLNTLTKNLIMGNRKELKNPTAWYFGQPGSGKSFACKREMVQVLLRMLNDELIVIDPEDEYRYLATELHGSIININNRSNVHINALDGDMDKPDFIATKADFCQMFVAQVYGREMDAEEKSLIDRAVRQMFTKYRKAIEDRSNPIKPPRPTLKTFKQELETMSNEKAKGLATGIEMYVDGSYDLFSGQTNIDVQNRFTVYNIRDAEETIKPVAMQVILASLWDKIIDNFNKGKRTWIWIDEIYMLFKYEYAAGFLLELFRRVRKFGAILTGITQNVEDLVNSATARTMLSNSEFIYMLSQAQSDLELLGSFFHISEQQMSYLSNAKKGSGILYNGTEKILIPFEDDFPKGTKLYEAMTSDFEERKALERGESIV